MPFHHFGGDHTVFLLYFTNVINYIYWLSNVKLIQNFWIYLWIQFANISLKIFMSMFMRTIELKFFFFVVFSTGFRI